MWDIDGKGRAEQACERLHKRFTYTRLYSGVIVSKATHNSTVSTSVLYLSDSPFAMTKLLFCALETTRKEIPYKFY